MVQPVARGPCAVQALCGQALCWSCSLGDGLALERLLGGVGDVASELAHVGLGVLGLGLGFGFG